MLAVGGYTWNKANHSRQPLWGHRTPKHRNICIWNKTLLPELVELVKLCRLPDRLVHLSTTCCLSSCNICKIRCLHVCTSPCGRSTFSTSPQCPSLADDKQHQTWMALKCAAGSGKFRSLDQTQLRWQWGKTFLMENYFVYLWCVHSSPFTRNQLIGVNCLDVYTPFYLARNELYLLVKYAMISHMRFFLALILCKARSHKAFCRKCRTKILVPNIFCWVVLDCNHFIIIAGGKEVPYLLRDNKLLNLLPTHNMERSERISIYLLDGVLPSSVLCFRRTYVERTFISHRLNSSIYNRAIYYEIYVRIENVGAATREALCITKPCVSLSSTK